MKISMEKISDDKAVLTLELKGKTYSQTWHDEGENGFVSTSLPIRKQLDNDNIGYESGLVDMLKEMEKTMSNFIILCSIY